MKPLLIQDEYIRLCDALKYAGIAETGGMAKMMILGGEVTVNGEICQIKGKKLFEGDFFAFDGEAFKIVR